MKIETAADKLLQIVKKRKKISFKECAKLLKSPENLLEEWAQFLEEEGLIDIEYRLATPYLVEKALTKEEETKKLESITKKRDFFVEKELESIELDESNLSVENIKQSFAKIKEAMQMELDAIREELQEVKEIGADERKEDKGSEEMKKYFLQKINAITKKMIDDEKMLNELEHKFEDDYEKTKEAVIDMSANLKNAANWIKYLSNKTGDQEKRLASIEKTIRKKELVMLKK